MSFNNSPSLLEEVFERVGSKVLGKLRNKVSFPREIVWVLGPLKAGKTTMGSFIAECRQHKRPPFTMNFKGGEFEHWLENLLFELVVMKSRDGVVVDNFFAFPDQCVTSLPYVHKFLGRVRAMKTRRGRQLPYTRFHFVYVTADLEVLSQRSGIAADDEEGQGRIKRDIMLYKSMESSLMSQYQMNIVDTGCPLEEAQERVRAELREENNGIPLKYKVQKLYIPPREGFGVAAPSHYQSQHDNFPRSQSWQGGNQRSSSWRSANYEEPPPPLSPFSNNYYSMTPSGPHSYAPGSSRFTFPEDQRARSFQGPPYSSNTPRTIPTSCRLSQMAENDRHYLLPSSTRNSYKPVTHNASRSFHNRPYTPTHSMHQPSQPSLPELGPRRMSIKSTDSSKIRDVFLQICASLEARFGKENLVYPREIIWMIGPPGAGKSTLARFLSDQREYASDPVVLREICQHVIAQNDGKLKIEQVVEQLMIKLFDEKYQYGVVVDGFVSITCARVVPFMFKYFYEIFDLNHNVHAPVFKFCVLYVNEDNSVRRQIVNYEQGEKESNKKFDAEEGRKLYRKFLKRTQQVVELIEMHFSFHLIDANGTLAQVQLMASAEIASESNGQLIHDATLTKALSPAASSIRNRRNPSWKSNSYRNNRTNSYRGNQRTFSSSANIITSPKLGGPTESFRLTPKNSMNTSFHHNLNVDISKYLNEVQDRELLNVLKQNVLEIVYGTSADGRNHPMHKLPSQKITNLDNANYENLSKHHVARPFIKGTHAMMYWDPTGRCYIVDRRFQFFTVRSQFYQAAHVGEGLLDGVLVVDENHHIVFIAHDAATHQGKRLKDCWFSQRMHECSTAVDDLNSSSDGTEPIHITFLEAVPTSEVQTLLELIQFKPNGLNRLLTMGERQVPVHGLSFVPDKSGFHPTNGPKTYTWTFEEDLARDFKVKAPFDQEQVSLHVQGPRNVDSCFQRCKFSEQHQEKFMGIVAQAGEADSFIVSCLFSKEDNLWIPEILQSRKMRASSMSVVQDTTQAWENRLMDADLIGYLTGGEQV